MKDIKSTVSAALLGVLILANLNGCIKYVGRSEYILAIEGLQNCQKEKDELLAACDECDLVLDDCMERLLILDGLAQ